ncbi:MAG TPA: endo-1,4-beta-xylanase [bacterium]|nr:endo-1,4-beta-xylanase [bacterium]
MKFYALRPCARILSVCVLLLSIRSFAQSDAIQTNVPALREVFAGDFYIGCLLSYPHVGFPDDPKVPGQSAVVAPNGGNLIKFHMNSMSPGNNMKPAYTVDINASASAYRSATAAKKDSIDTHPIVAFNGNLIAQLNWAQRQGFTFRGHTLVWHSQTPAEFFRTGYTSSGARLSKEKMTARMDNYIGSVIRLLHAGWPGLLSAIDVVNEAVTDAGVDRTTDSEWYLTFGDNSYLMKAFELTRRHTLAQGESQIKLYYNDYNTHLPAKADGIVRICAPIFQAGFLDGIGMQEHDSNSSPTAEEWIATYDKFAPICTEMAVTELDVTTGSAAPSARLLQTQANQYGQLFKCFVERSYFSGRGKIICVAKDGLNDEWTFKKNQSSSLWDTKNQCKPAFYAVADVGLSYNALDSLIAEAGTLQESHYTADSWSALTTALGPAQSAMARNYSNSLSAADTLKTAAAQLAASLQALAPKTSAVASAASSRAGVFSLGQNYPNPFNPVTRIPYTLTEADEISLRVYTLTGQLAAVLYEGRQHAGAHLAAFDGSGLAGGVYIYTLRSSHAVESKRFILLK